MDRSNIYLWLLALLACAFGAVLAVRQAHSEHELAHPTARRVQRTPLPTATPSVARIGIDIGRIGAATTLRAVEVRSEPMLQAPALSALRGGIALPVDGHRGAFVHVLTPCETGGWVHTSDLHLHPKAQPGPRSLDDATIVLDAGHGGLEPGAIGPNGLKEKDANLDIVDRLMHRLGDARVFLTRTSDHTAGLGYRSKLATALGAHAFVSVHNNAAPKAHSGRPGTETYHQVHSETSKRLATLLWQDIFEALDPLNVTWARNPTVGPKARANRHGQDYYAVLRGSGVPAVIVEAMFISNAAEEELLRSGQTHELLADALSRGLSSYVDGGTAASAQPYPLAQGRTWHNPACVDPA